MKIQFIVLATLMLAGFLCGNAYGDSVVFTLSDPNQIAVSGQTTSYLGTIEAALGNVAPVFLNGDAFDFTGPISLDDTPFLTNFPLSIVPGASYTDVIFDITLPPGLQDGDFSGSFSIFGGANDNAEDLLGVATFNATVAPAATTPEPSSWLLLFTGVFGIAWFTESNCTRSSGQPY